MSTAHREYNERSPSDLRRLYQELEISYFGDNPQQRAENEHFRRVIAGARVFVDVGASLGQYTRLANEVIKGGDILSLEADPARFNRLAELCQGWAKTSGNHIVPSQAAICERDGWTSFFVANANVSGGLSLDRETENLAQNFAWQETEICCMTSTRFLGIWCPISLRSMWKAPNAAFWTERGASSRSGRPGSLSKYTHGAIVRITNASKTYSAPFCANPIAATGNTFRGAVKLFSQV